MLTKELLRFSLRRDEIVPRTVDVGDRTLLLLARNLIDLYGSSVGQTVEELAELAQPIVNSYRSPVIAKGLNKLLLDRCRFRVSDPELESWRLAVFQAAAALLGNRSMNDLSHYRQAVAQQLQTDPDSLSRRLYADLALRQPLEEFQRYTPEQLLQRYNMAQAQGLLLWSTALEVKLSEPDTGKRRQLLRHLRFFRLLTRIHQQQDEIHITVDGPLSLLQHTQKYGLQLAAFLPALCAMSRWQIAARIRMEQQPQAWLRLDQSSGLQSHYQQTWVYRPEAITSFAEQFNNQDDKDDNQSRWQMMEESPILTRYGAELVVPDFSFQHDSGLVVHLELFHRWHRGPLLRRLEQLATHDDDRCRLAIGVERALAKEQSTQALLQQSLWYQSYGFEFNEFPPVRRVMGCLNRFLATTTTLAT
ncbi:MAG: DUF790 family protein [Magnetococcales bacterium]|nr:DUF790 family protein [Magnetococcales bacterium]